MKRLLFTVGLATWLVGSVPAAQAQDPSPTEVAWAQAEQETLPGWEARESAAKAKVAARESWFAGKETPFEGAFPRWVGGPINRLVTLKGRLAELDQADVARARQRQVPVPELGNAKRTERYLAQRKATLEAEAAADALERRLLVEVLAVLESRPALTARQLAPIRAPWEAALAVTVPDDADEATRLAAQTRAAQADRSLRELDALVSALLLDAARERPGAVVADRIDRLEADGDPVAVQLALLWSFADEADRTRIGDALSAWWSARTWAEELPNDASAAEMLEARLAALDGSAPWQVARREAIQARIDAIRATLAQKEPAAVEVPDFLEDPSDQARRAEQEAALAEQEAERALADATDSARSQQRANVLRALADARQRSAKLWGKAEEWQQSADKLKKQLDNDLTGIDNKIHTIRTRRIGQSAPDPDAVYRSVRDLSQKLRGDPVARGSHLVEARRILSRTEVEVAQDRARILAEQADLSGIPEPMVQAELEAALETWTEQLTEQTKAADALIAAATAERDASLRALSRLREQRKVLRSWVSASERYRDRGYLLKDVAQELALLGPSLLMRARSRLDDVLALPAKLTDFNVLRGLTGALLWTGLWVGAWLWVRAQADDAARLATQRLQRLRPELRPTDLRNLEDPVAMFLRALVDLLLGWALIGRIGDLVPELGFVLLVYLQVALYYALLAAFDLAVIPNQHVRPALVVLRKDPWELARKTFQYAVGLLIARSFVYSLLWDVLGLDVIAGLVSTVFFLALVVLVVWSLDRWEPHLRDRVRKRNQDTPVVAWLAREPESRFVQPVRGAAILTFFLVDAVVELAYWLARERSGVAWLMHAFARFRDPEEGPELAPVGPEVVEAIGEGGGPIQIDRPEVRSEVAAAIEQWRKESRRGLVALVGDRGSCKRLACEQVQGLFDDCELAWTDVRLTRQLVTESDMVGWLSDILELPDCTDADMVIARLLELEPQGWLLRDVHRAWTRQVGGFAAITSLLYILNATSHRHFWVLSLHKLSWEFFASSGSLVDVGVFRSVITLKALSAQDLRDLCIGRTEAAGYSLDTSRLMRNSAFGGDPAVEEERGIHVFFRLLAEAAQGNPTVALQLWLACLHPTDDPKVLLVHGGDALVSDTVPNLSDPALFTLVALRIQDELAEAELVEVTNLNRAVVRATLRDLISRGLVARDGDRMRIPEGQLPAVTRTLKRRHFLHLGVA